MPAKRSAARRRAEGMSVSEFKSHCLEVVEGVRTEGREVVITKHGEAVARLVPIRPRGCSLRGAWKGLVEIRGEIVQSDLSDEWEAMRK